MYQAIQDKTIKKSTLYIIYGVFITILGTLLFSFSSAFADNQNVTYNVNVESSLSIEVSSNTVSLLLNPASNPFDTEDLTITVGTNYTNGYKLYIDSDSTSLLNDDYETNYYMETLPDTTTVTNFPDNYWGYRISSGSTGEPTITDSDYHPFASDTLVSSSSTAVNGNETVLTFAAKANYNKPAGSYDNTFNFSSVINPVTYSITYTDTTGDTIANMPSPNPATGMITGGSVAISSTIPTRDGYTFKAWCDGTVSNSGTTCTGTEYSAGGSYPITTTVGPDVSVELTATWDINTLTVYFDTGISAILLKKSNSDYTVVNNNGMTLSGLTEGARYEIIPLYSKGYTFSNLTVIGGSKEIGTDGYYQYIASNESGSLNITTVLLPTSSPSVMQNFTLTNCPTYPIAVNDSRDNSIYYVQKLIDGKCWMLDNLRFSSTSVGLTSNNSNVPYSSSNPWYLPASTSSNFYSYTEKRINSSYNNTVPPISFGPGSGKIGTYYNYCAASAGTYCYAANAGTGDASYDVCPKGWRMPTGSSQGEVDNLYSSYLSIQEVVQKALSITYSDGYSSTGTTPIANMTTFHYLTSTFYNKNIMYVLEGNTASIPVSTAGARDRQVGLNIRCVLK